MRPWRRIIFSVATPASSSSRGPYPVSGLIGGGALLCGTSLHYDWIKLITKDSPCIGRLSSRKVQPRSYWSCLFWVYQYHQWIRRRGSQVGWSVRLAVVTGTVAVHSCTQAHSPVHCCSVGLIITANGQRGGGGGGGVRFLCCTRNYPGAWPTLTVQLWKNGRSRRQSLFLIAKPK